MKLAYLCTTVLLLLPVASAEDVVDSAATHVYGELPDDGEEENWPCSDPVPYRRECFCPLPEDLEDELWLLCLILP